MGDRREFMCFTTAFKCILSHPRRSLGWANENILINKLRDSLYSRCSFNLCEFFFLIRSLISAFVGFSGTAAVASMWSYFDGIIALASLEEFSLFIQLLINFPHLTSNQPSRAIHQMKKKERFSAFSFSKKSLLVLTFHFINKDE